MTTKKLKVYRDGRPLYLDAVTVGATTITVEGSLLRIARAHHEMFDVIEAADEISALLRRERLADLFTFTQILPETTPKYDFPMEWDAISALPVTSYEHWFTHQIRTADRKEIKKASRRGLEIRSVEFDDTLVSGITRIFNEAPVRRGRPFWHYGKTLDQVRTEVGQDLDRSQFIGAYFEGELIGFHKLIGGRCFAVPVLCLSSLKHRDKLTDTALMSAAVRFCSDRGLRYLLYGDWRRGSHRHFLERHGFEKVLLPRYYVPLTFWGSLCLMLRTHKGWRGFLKGLLPEATLEAMLALRSRWYDWRFPTERDQAENTALAISSRTGS
jgi:hypothetical protein